MKHFKINLVDFDQSILHFLTEMKLKFSFKDLVTFTEEILNGKLHFLCSARLSSDSKLLH